MTSDMDRFRVWDGEQMHLPPHDYVLDSEGNLWDRWGPNGNGYIGGQVDYDVMFSTGLTDKAEDPIYGKDLVRYKDRVWEVTYKRGGYCLSRRGDRPVELGVPSSVELFVFGNVYETPEL